MAAKIIVKSKYIKNVKYKMNVLMYAGSKIEAQLAVLADGSTVEVSELDKITDSSQLSGIQITVSGGKKITLTPEQYREKVHTKNKEMEEQIISGNGEADKIFDGAEYVKYIAYRPSVQKAPACKHGLFTLEGDADMAQEMERLEKYKDNIMWSEIISLDREDAERVGYDNRAAWQALVIAKSMEIAKIYNINPKNLVLNAAYHDKDHHPHLHMYLYSTDAREGYVKDMQYASERLKSMFFNEIFKDDVSYLKAVKTDQRGQLEERLSEMLLGMKRKSYKPPQEICNKLLELAVVLQDCKGKNVYAFHKAETKARVDKIVELMVTKRR